MLRKIDDKGYFVEDVILDNIPTIADAEWNELSDGHYIKNPCPEGFYKPKWNGTGWVEGLTAEEIETILSVMPTQTTEERLEELAVGVNDALHAIMMLSIE